MPLTDQDIRALTYLAKHARDETCASHKQARQWDEQGIYANIAKVRHLHLADVGLSVLRAADDPKADNPGVIANTSSPNWSERATNRPVPREPYDAAKFCHVCGKSSHAGPTDHVFETEVERQRRMDRAPKPPLPRTKGCPR